MSAISNYFYPSSGLYFVPPICLSQGIEKIKTAAQSAWAQLAIAFSINIGFCALFGNSFVPASMMAFSLIMAGMLINLTIHALWQQCHGTNASPGWLSLWLEKRSGQLARASLVNTLTLKVNRLLHEMGHAGAALMTYVKAQPTIVANCCQASTTYNISYGLTPFGKWLGEGGALLFTTAAGLAFPLFCAMSEFAIAYQIGDKHPQLKEWLIFHGVSQWLDTILYCSLLAYNTSKERVIHDSMMLWKVGGIHPLVTLALVVGLPAAELWFLAQ